jgi:hypothetical protein
MNGHEDRVSSRFDISGIARDNVVDIGVLNFANSKTSTSDATAVAHYAAIARRRGLRFPATSVLLSAFRPGHIVGTAKVLGASVTATPSPYCVGDFVVELDEITHNPTGEQVGFDHPRVILMVGK